MKRILLIISLLFTGTVFAQNAKPKSIINSKFLENLKVTQFIFDGGYINGEIKGATSQGGTISTGFVFNNVWHLGMSFDFMFNRDIRIDTAFPVVNPRYNYNCFMVNNEFLIGSNYFITAAIPIRVGVGYTNYYDKYSDNNQNKSIADDAFFVAEAGASVYFNLLKNLSIGGGAKYRYASGVQRIGVDSDYKNFTIEAKLRFRFMSDFSTPKPEEKSNGL